MSVLETIAALATPIGVAGVGIIRVSGPEVVAIAHRLLKKCPPPRYAQYGPFYAADDSIIDEGIALYFKGPHSFTGEDILELQGHGGPVVLDFLLQTVLTHSKVRLARPGEFSERAFLNGKLDLVQAEAIADLIQANSLQAAKSAMVSLQGEFSKKIHALVDALITLRLFVESAIDFPEEDGVDFLEERELFKKIEVIENSIEDIFKQAKQGSVLREGLKIVLAGKPNAGKSSLLNALTEKSSAIVTPIPGTTRDVLRESIQIEGLSLQIIDTAGLRESEDLIEKEGIQRALTEIAEADVILFLIDATDPVQLEEFDFINDPRVVFVINKIDLVTSMPNFSGIFISAKTGQGLEELRNYLKNKAGLNNMTEGTFIARRRHLVAIQTAKEALARGKLALTVEKAGELFAEDCRVAQNALSSITGEFTSDDLLGKIFSEFCIGK